MMQNEFGQTNLEHRRLKSLWFNGHVNVRADSEDDKIIFSLKTVAKSFLELETKTNEDTLSEAPHYKDVMRDTVSVPFSGMNNKKAFIHSGTIKHA